MGQQFDITTNPGGVCKVSVIKKMLVLSVFRLTVTATRHVPPTCKCRISMTGSSLPHQYLIQKRLYTPTASISSSCVPRTANTPRSTTRARRIVDKRWATTIVVLPAISRRSACRTACSDSETREGGRLIRQQKRRVLQYCPGNGDSLLLAAGEPLSVRRPSPDSRPPPRPDRHRLVHIGTTWSMPAPPPRVHSPLYVRTGGNCRPVLY